jgi:hypothetical protein
MSYEGLGSSDFEHLKFLKIMIFSHFNELFVTRVPFNFKACP